MKASKVFLCAVLVVLIIVVIYAVVAKPHWANPEMWLASMIESPKKVYRRSNGTFDEEAALALERVTSQRDPSPGDHLLAATIITQNILGQEHRPEFDRQGNPTTRAVERTQLRHEMIGRARDHYIAALGGLNRQMAQPVRHRAQPRARTPATRGGRPGRPQAAQPRQTRHHVRPPPPDAGFIIDAALDFAIGGVINAMQNDPLLAVMIGGNQPDTDPDDVLAQMTLFIDLDLANAANQTRGQMVEQRRGVADQAAAGAGGAAGVFASTFLDASQGHTNDPQNSHDSGVSGCLRGILSRLRRDQEGATLPTLDEIEADIRGDWMKLAEGDKKGLDDALAVLDKARAGEIYTGTGATDEEVLRRIWARADDPKNADNRSKLRQSSFDNLKDAWENGIHGRKIACVTGRQSRQFGSLSTLDWDVDNWNVSTLEQFKNDLFKQAGELIRREVEKTAGDSADPKMVKVAKSYLASTAAEMQAIGEIDDAANEQFGNMLRQKIDQLTDDYAQSINAKSPGAIPLHMVAPVKAEAKAAVP